MFDTSLKLMRWMYDYLENINISTFIICTILAIHLDIFHNMHIYEIEEDIRRKRGTRV